jgi:hypothetical protein
MIAIDKIIDDFFFSRFTAWRRTDKGVEILWDPTDPESWIPVKDWHNEEITFRPDRLLQFARFIQNHCAGPAEKKEVATCEQKVEHKRKVKPYRLRPRENKPSGDGYATISDLAKHYGMQPQELKDYMDKARLKYGRYCVAKWPWATSNYVHESTIANLNRLFAHETDHEDTSR